MLHTFLRITTAAVFICIFSIAFIAQTPETDDVVRITTKLVRVDAIVTDKDGKHVTDLSLKDFELYQDGKKQELSGVTYIRTDPAMGPVQITNTLKTDKNASPTPSVRLRPNDAGRMIAFVVDDGNCLSTTVGMRAAREGLLKFIREQMMPNDRVAIYQTRAGSSMLQQFTNDKNILLRSAGKVRWYPPTGGCALGDGSFNAAAKDNSFDKLGPNGSSTKQIESDAEKAIRHRNEDRMQDAQTVGTLGVLRYVVSGLARVPGRKVLFLLSDGVPVYRQDRITMDSLSAVKQVTELANRASVVINTVDSRGVYDVGMIEARDEVRTTNEDLGITNRISGDRYASDRSRQDGLSLIADETGGKFYKNSNDLDSPIRQGLSIEKGYYLLSYEPEDETFKGKKFNKVEIKVTRPELTVASRSGFMGVTDESLAPKKRQGDSELYEALTAPLANAGLGLSLTAYHVNTGERSDIVRSLVHIDGNDLVFVDDAGQKKANFDVVAVTLNEKNEVVDEFTRSHTIKVEAAALPMIEKYGLIYSADVTIKKPGNYNFRMAIRDTNSKMIGTTAQPVEISDLQKKDIFVAGLTISLADADGKFIIPQAADAANSVSLIQTSTGPAVRKFKQNSIIAYAYTIYNAKLDAASGQPKLTIQLNLYRNGELISEGKPQPADLVKQTDMRRINDHGFLRLNSKVDIGDYTLQLIVKDLLAPQKQSTWTQSTDFEVVD